MASNLLGVLAGAAVNVVGTMTGSSGIANVAGNILDSLLGDGEEMTPGKRSEMKQKFAELERQKLQDVQVHTQQMQDLSNQRLVIATRDSQSAREANVTIQMSPDCSLIAKYAPYVIALVAVLGLLGCSGWLLVHGLPEGMPESTAIMVIAGVAWIAQAACRFMYGVDSSNGKPQHGAGIKKKKLAA